MSKRNEKLIRNAVLAYNDYISACDKVAKIVQKYINWDDNIGCDYFPEDGLCITTTESDVCPVESLLKLIDKVGEVSFEEFKRMCI